MKYIVYGEENRILQMEIFCEISSDDHALRAEKLGILDEVVAAGFLKFDADGQVHCGGFSNSLSDKLGRNIESRGAEDEKLFRLHNKTSSRW